MEGKRRNRTVLCSYLCAALTTVVLILLLMPFWHFEAEGKAGVSISSYVWFPERNAELELYLAEKISGEPGRNELTLMLNIQMLTGILGIVLCIMKPVQRLVRLLPAFCGSTGMLGYLVIPALQLGSGKMLCLILCLILFMVSVSNLEPVEDHGVFTIPHSE